MKRRDEWDKFFERKGKRVRDHIRKLIRSRDIEKLCYCYFVEWREPYIWGNEKEDSPTIYPEALAIAASLHTHEEKDIFATFGSYCEMLREVTYILTALVEQHRARLSCLLAQCEKNYLAEWGQQLINQVRKSIEVEAPEAIKCVDNVLKKLAAPPQYNTLMWDSVVSQKPVEAQMLNTSELWRATTNYCDLIRKEFSELKALIIALEKWTTIDNVTEYLPEDAKREIDFSKFDSVGEVAPMFSRKVLHEREARGETITDHERLWAIVPYYEEIEEDVEIVQAYRKFLTDIFNEKSGYFYDKFYSICGEKDYDKEFQQGEVSEQGANKFYSNKDEKELSEQRAID